MSNDDLNALWIAGTPLAQLVSAAKQTKDALLGRIARLRKREGEQRWPRRPNVIKQGARRSPPHLHRAGKTTLPPLGSLT